MHDFTCKRSPIFTNLIYSKSILTTAEPKAAGIKTNLQTFGGFGAIKKPSESPSN
jgi:hypothetical protein